MVAGCPVSIIVSKAADISTVEQDPGLSHLALPTPAARVPLMVDITAPAHMGAVHGWRCHDDNPEELGDEDARLSLLAAVHGAFYPVEISSVEGTRVEVGAEGGASCSGDCTDV